MNKHKRSQLLLAIIFVTALLSSCGPGQAFGPTITPSPSPTQTPSQTPSPTLAPTITPTTIPAIGDTRRSDNWEATILQAVYRKSFSIAGTFYSPKPGYMGFDVIVKVKNLNPTSNPSTNVENDVVIDAQGESQLAICWGAHDIAETEGKDLLELTFIGCQTGNIYTMEIESESIIRYHFTIEDTNLGKTIYFKFEDLPAVPFIINKSEE